MKWTLLISVCGGATGLFCAFFHLGVLATIVSSGFVGLTLAIMRPKKKILIAVEGETNHGD